MSLRENLQTAERFASTWGSSPDWVMVEGVKSVYFETHRLDHNYPFFIDECGTFVEDPENPSNKLYVKDIIDKTSYLGRTEMKIFNDLERLAFQNEANVGSRMAVWFSPPFPGRYPCSKVIIHEIVDGIDRNHKTIFNLVKVFDLSADSCVYIAKSIFPGLEKISHPEELRSMLIIPTEESQIDQLIEKVDELNKDVVKPAVQLTEDELTKRAKNVVKMVRSGENPKSISLEMNRADLLGTHSITCPTLSEFLSSGFIDKYGPREFKCPHKDCEKINLRPENTLLTECQHCHKPIKKC